MSRRGEVMCAWLGVMLLCCAPGAAFAQDGDSQDFGTPLTICGLVHLGLLTTIAPTTIFLAPDYAGDPTIRRTLMAAALDRYIEEHPQQWAGALALGGGEGLADLGAMLDVEAAQQPDLGARLRQQRGALLAIARQPRGIARGQRLLAAFDELITEVER